MSTARRGQTWPLAQWFSAWAISPRHHVAESGDSLGCHTGEAVRLASSGPGPGKPLSTSGVRGAPRRTVQLPCPSVSGDRRRTLVSIRGGGGVPPWPGGPSRRPWKARGPAAAPRRSHAALPWLPARRGRRLPPRRPRQPVRQRCRHRLHRGHQQHGRPHLHEHRRAGHRQE